MASFHDIIAISNKNSAEEIKNFLSRNDTKLMSGKSLNSRYKHSKITGSGYQKSTAKTSKKTNSQSSIGPVGDSSGKGGPPKKPSRDNPQQNHGTDNSEYIKKLVEDLNQILEHEINRICKEFHEYNELTPLIEEITQQANNEINEFSKLEKNKKIYSINNSFNKSLINIIRIVRRIENKYRLRRAAQHANVRGNSPNQIYINDDANKRNTKPKISQLLERDKAIDLTNTETSKTVIIPTPFGIVNIRKGSKFSSRVIFTSEFQKGATYTQISSNLDEYFRHNGKENTIAMLKDILKYLETYAKPEDTVNNALESLQDRVTNSKLSFTSQKQRESAATLCAILMLCESGEDRSNNGGKRERGLIRTLIKNIQQETTTTPFGDALGSVERGNYKEGYYTPSARGNSIEPGGNVRGKVMSGKVIKEAVKNLTDTIILNDEINNAKIDYSDNSEENITESIDDKTIKDKIIEEQASIFISNDGRRYEIDSNPGLAGGCLWRILERNGVSDLKQIFNSRNSNIIYGKDVNYNNLGDLLDYINRNNNENIYYTIHIDVFSYDGFYSPTISGNIAGTIDNNRNLENKTINIALIYGPDGNGHYVEQMQ